MFPTSDFFAFSFLRIDKSLYHLQYAVDTAPQNIGEAASMPESAYKESDEQIQTVAPSRYSVTAKRNVDIVSEPCGERYVPPAPEFFDGKREIRTLEIRHQVDAEQSGTADRNIRIPGEIAVDFNGKHNGDNDKDESDVGVYVVIYFVDNAGKDVGNHKFLKISPGHEF